MAGSQQFAVGACSGILYQHSYGGSTQLKTLETDANYIKAAVLLYQITHQRSYLTQAQEHYQAVRQYYLSPGTSLYTVYVFDNGTSCTQVPAQYFGSVNGLMIWNGYTLAQLTGQRSYLAEAIATAQDVAAHLGDGTGVYADLQAENDITEPLIESMYLLAAHGQGFARRWLLAAANASAGSVNTRTGAYGRFFDGPPPAAPVTAWQGSGGLALAQVAGALDPQGQARRTRGSGHGASFVRDNLALSRLPGLVQLHRARRGHHRHDRRGLLLRRPRPGVHRRGPDVRPDRDLAEQVEFGQVAPGFGAVRLAVAAAGAAHHRDRARRRQRQAGRVVLPHDRVLRGQVSRGYPMCG